MTIPTDVVGQFRTLWADRFVDTITIRRVTGTGTVDPVTFAISGATDSTVYTGGALIRPTAGGVDADHGAAQTRIDRYDILMPYTATGVEPDDEVTVDASLVGSVDLIGSVLVVESVEVDSYQTRIRLRCNLADRGSE